MPKIVSYLSRHTPRGIKNIIGGPLRTLIGAAASSDNLEQLGIKHSTDKLYHGYLPHYQRHFASRRESACTVLEIGVGGFDDPTKGGESLRMWADYFPGAHIHGIDIIDKSVHDGTRVTTHQGSQDDPAFLRALIDKIGTPDVIIDDGSHVNKHIITSFTTLFPLLAKTGVYVIEDMQTAYLPEAGGDYHDLNNPSTSTGLIKSLVDSINYKYILDREAASWDGIVTSICVYPKLCIIEKGVNDPPLSQNEISGLAAARIAASA